MNIRPNPRVIHPDELLDKPEGPVAKTNEWCAAHLAIVFGLVWTIWIFFTTPIIAQFLSPAIQAKFFFYASGWVQLFALPLLVYVGNKVQKSSDAQSEVQHQSLTHIANVSDDVKALLVTNNALTDEIHAFMKKE